MFSAYYVTDTENTKIKKLSPSSGRDSGSGEGGRGDFHPQQLFSSWQLRRVEKAVVPKVGPSPDITENIYGSLSMPPGCSESKLAT